MPECMMDACKAESDVARRNSIKPAAYRLYITICTESHIKQIQRSHACTHTNIHDCEVEPYQDDSDYEDHTSILCHATVRYFHVVTINTDGDQNMCATIMHMHMSPI